MEGGGWSSNHYAPVLSHKPPALIIMRVLHILEATYGGTRRHVLDLLPALQARGINNTLIYSPWRNPDFAHDADMLEQHGVQTCAIPMTRGWGGVRDAQSLRLLHAHLKASHYDVIHCHSTKAGLLGRIVALCDARSTPVVYTPHCPAFATGLPVRQRQAARLIEKSLAPLTRHFISVAQWEYSVLHRAGLLRSNNGSIIYNGINVQEFDAVANNTSTQTRRGVTIGCFGRLTRQKHQGMLLQALPIVQRQIPAAHLLLVGGGEDAGVLQALAEKLGISHSVTWCGELEEARPLYKICDVVAQPSRWEGCPYSILEAMAARRAVLARGTGGVPELLTPETGILFKVSRATTVADHIVSLAKDDRWRDNLGNTARQRVEQQFHLKTMTNQTMNVYEKIADGTTRFGG